MFVTHQTLLRIDTVRAWEIETHESVCHEVVDTGFVKTPQVLSNIFSERYAKSQTESDRSTFGVRVRRGGRSGFKCFMKISRSQPIILEFTKCRSEKSITNTLVVLIEFLWKWKRELCPGVRTKALCSKLTTHLRIMEMDPCNNPPHPVSTLL